MDIGLFKKYSQQLEVQKNTKKDIINYIQQETGVELKEETVIVLKKTITLTISSVQKSKLIQKNIKELLIKKGYTLTF